MDHITAHAEMERQEMDITAVKVLALPSSFMIVFAK
jgi:hypothetical protein